MAAGHLSPRILSAWDQLDTAVRRLQTALEQQKDKVDASEVDRLAHQMEGLKEDNLALTQELESYAAEDHAATAQALQTQVSSLSTQTDTLLSENQTLKQVNADFSARLVRLIGTVEHVLEEEN